MKANLTVKVLGIIGVTLLFGFTLMGATSLWLSIDSTLHQQKLSSSSNAAIIKKTIEEFMLKGEREAVIHYVEQLKRDNIVLDLAIFRADGKQPGGTSDVN